MPIPGPEVIVLNAMVRAQMSAERTKAATIFMRDLYDMHVHGQTNWHRHEFGRIFYSGEVKFLMEQTDAVWLVDLIAANFTDKRLPKVSRQLWRLRGGDRWIVSAFGEMDRLSSFVQQVDMPQDGFPLPDIWLTLEYVEDQYRLDIFWPESTDI